MTNNQEIICVVWTILNFFLCVAAIANDHFIDDYGLFYEHEQALEESKHYEKGNNSVFIHFDH